MARKKLGQTEDLFSRLELVKPEPISVAVSTPLEVAIEVASDREPHPDDLFVPAALEGTPFACSACGTPGRRIVLVGGFVRPDLCASCWHRAKGRIE